MAAMRQERWAGPLVVNNTRSMTTQQWAALAESRLPGFWLFHPEPCPRPDIVDETQWVLEGVSGGE
jgi:hypothetical protein